MTIDRKELNFEVLDKILKRCERIADTLNEEFGDGGIEIDPNYLKACELMSAAEFDGLSVETYFEIFDLVRQVYARWGW